jgi:hypothetical protein
MEQARFKAVKGSVQSDGNLKPRAVNLSPKNQMHVFAFSCYGMAMN